MMPIIPDHVAEHHLRKSVDKYRHEMAAQGILLPNSTDDAIADIRSLMSIKEKYEFNQSRGRPEWYDYFIGIAFIVSRRSLDPNTKHGCVITDRRNHVLSVGYNSFPHGMNDVSIPTNRPDPEKPDELSKYDFVEGTHSERNAVFNCMVSPWMIPGGAVAYVTGEPCNPCIVSLWQSNIKTVYYAQRAGSLLLNEKTRRVRDKIVGDTGIELIEVKPQLDWMLEGIDELRGLGFIK